jgi:hypothetical protein
LPPINKAVGELGDFKGKLPLKIPAIILST